MSTILCFGELLMRMSPVHGEWIRNNYMPVFIGGAELNTATALAKWGLPVSYLTTLPDNDLSKEIVASIEEKNISTEKIFFSGGRIGIYYLPQGADLKNSGVIYDRAGSSFSELKPGSINWDEVLKDVSWFHFSAICPALNKDVAEVCREGAEAAASKNIRVSIDLNYRSKLWQYGKQPHEVMPGIVQFADLVMGNVWAAEKMLGIPVKDGLVNDKEACLQQSLQTSEELIQRFARCKQVANTFRFDSDGGLDYYTTIYSGGKLLVSGEHHATEVVDRVGSGDCFMAGLIYGNYHSMGAQETIDFAAAAAFNKLFIKGDATTASVDEIKAYTNYA